MHNVVTLEKQVFAHGSAALTVCVNCHCVCNSLFYRTRSPWLNLRATRPRSAPLTSTRRRTTTPRPRSSRRPHRRRRRPASQLQAAARPRHARRRFHKCALERGRRAARPGRLRAFRRRHFQEKLQHLQAQTFYKELETLGRLRSSARRCGSTSARRKPRRQHRP